jgi:hypothetical protein
MENFLAKMVLTRPLSKLAAACTRSTGHLGVDCKRHAMLECLGGPPSRTSMYAAVLRSESPTTFLQKRVSKEVYYNIIPILLSK